MKKRERKALAIKLAAKWIGIKGDWKKLGTHDWDHLFEACPDWDCDLGDLAADGSFEMSLDFSPCSYDFKVSPAGKVGPEKIRYWDMTPDPEEAHWNAVATHNERFNY